MSHWGLHHCPECDSTDIHYTCMNCSYSWLPRGQGELLPVAQKPVAWRFRTRGVPHSNWRLCDDEALVQQMRDMGHWDIVPLVEQTA